MLGLKFATCEQETQQKKDKNKGGTMFKKVLVMKNVGGFEKNSRSAKDSPGS